MKGKICLVTGANVGVLGSAERKVTEDGIEMTFAVNHLATFLLTNLLPGRGWPTASRSNRVAYGFDQGRFSPVTWAGR